MRLTRSQFAKVVGADEKWVENTARALGRRLACTPAEARWMGMVRLLTGELAIPVARAAELAEEALRHPADARALSLAPSADAPAAVVIDLARYYSTFAASLSAALEHGGPRRRGRRGPHARGRSRGALAAAVAHGVDVSLLREALERPPAERLARLDANAAFLRALRPVPVSMARARSRKRTRD